MVLPSRPAAPPLGALNMSTWVEGCGVWQNEHMAPMPGRRVDEAARTMNPTGRSSTQCTM